MSIPLGPTLETERLILRPPIAADLDGWAAFAADPEAARFLGGPQPRATAWRGLATVAGAWALHGFGMFSLVEKATGRWIGRAGPWRPEGWPCREISWGLLPAAQGRGFAREGVSAAVDWAVDSLGWPEFACTIDPANAASVALARSLGLAPSGRLRRPAPYDDGIDAWRQTAASWRERRPQVPSFGPHQPGR